MKTRLKITFLTNYYKVLLFYCTIAENSRNGKKNDVTGKRYELN
jgi:hypothetical protein